MKTLQLILITILLTIQVQAAVVWEASRDVYEGGSDDAYFWGAYFDAGASFTKVTSYGGGNASGTDPNGWWNSFGAQGKAIWSPPAGDGILYNAESRAATDNMGTGASGLKQTVFNVGRPPRFTTLPPANVIIQRNQIYVIPFTGYDPNNNASASAVAANPSIVQVQGNSLNGTTIKGLTGGGTSLTIQLSDGVAQAFHMLNVTVLNTMPTIGSINNMAAQVNIPANSLSFNVFDADGDNISLSADCDVPAIVPPGNISFDVQNGPSGSRTLTVIPAGPGVANITVYASDGISFSQTTFQITVTTNPPLITGLNPNPFKIVRGTSKTFQIDMISPIPVNLDLDSGNTNLIPEFIGGGTNFAVTPLNTNGTSYEVSVQANTNIGDTFILIKAFGSGLTSTGLTVQVIPPNAPPVLQNNAALTVNRSGSKAISTANLSVSDVDNIATELIYVLQNPPTNGVIKNGGLTVTSWSQSEIDAGLIAYQHNGDTNSATDSFDFQVGDQINPNLGPISFVINILPFEESEIPGGDPNVVIDSILTNGLAGITNGNPGVKELIAEKGLGFFKGKYQGLSASSPWTQDAAGFFNLKLKKNGKSKVVHKKVSEKLKWKGDFNSNGVWVVQKGSDILAMALTTNKQLYGYITNTDGVRPPSAIVANAAYYSAKKNPWKGQNRFLVKIGGDTNEFGDGLIKVNKAGTAKLNLKLSDGSKLTHKARVAFNGTWPLFKSLFKKQGSIQTFGNIKTEKSDTNTVSGKVYLQEPLGLTETTLSSQ